MKLLVVILNYRVTDLTIDCLKSLVPEIPACTRHEGGRLRERHRGRCRAEVAGGDQQQTGGSPGSS